MRKNVADNEQDDEVHSAGVTNYVQLPLSDAEMKEIKRLKEQQLREERAAHEQDIQAELEEVFREKKAAAARETTRVAQARARFLATPMEQQDVLGVSVTGVKHRASVFGHTRPVLLLRPVDYPIIAVPISVATRNVLTKAFDCAASSIKFSKLCSALASYLIDSTVYQRMKALSMVVDESSFTETVLIARIAIGYATEEALSRHFAMFVQEYERVAAELNEESA